MKRIGEAHPVRRTFGLLKGNSSFVHTVVGRLSEGWAHTRAKQGPKVYNEINVQGKSVQAFHFPLSRTKAVHRKMVCHINGKCAPSR